jgi:hypothetical protein
MGVGSGFGDRVAVAEGVDVAVDVAAVVGVAVGSTIKGVVGTWLAVGVAGEVGRVVGEVIWLASALAAGCSVAAHAENKATAVTRKQQYTI